MAKKETALLIQLKDLLEKGKILKIVKNAKQLLIKNLSNHRAIKSSPKFEHL